MNAASGRIFKQPLLGLPCPLTRVPRLHPFMAPDSGVAIFAHYDDSSIIREDVVYYLSGLREVVSDIIFVSDTNIPVSELEKIKHIVTCSIVEAHGEYDFGSYKRGFISSFELGILESKSFCIFANDSVYGPLFPLGPVFSEMQSRQCDFWGITENYFRHRRPRPHLQSFFLVFDREVFLSSHFIDFVSSVRRQASKATIIDNYEIGLTSHLVEHGFCYSSFIPRNTRVSNLMMSLWVILIIKGRVPFLKKSLYRRRYRGVRRPYAWLLRWVLRRFTNFPVDLL